MIRAKAVILCCGASGRLGLARLGLPVRHLRESLQRRRRLLAGVSRRRGADRHRVLPDQPADQGLQRSGLRVRDRAARRPHRQRARTSLHRERLLERAHDAGVLPRAALRERPGLPQARPPGARDADRDRARPAPHRAPEPRALPRGARQAATAATWWRCTSPRSACAADTAARACGSTSAARPPCRACTPPATWPACRTTTCSARSPTARSAREHALAYVAEVGDRRRRLDEQIAGRARSASSRRSSRPNGIPHHQYEYKVRRLVNDYLQPPKSGHRHGGRARALHARRAGARGGRAPTNPHELMRVMEGQLHPRLRRDGGARLAVSHREPLGPVPLPAGLSRARRRRTGSCT